MAKRYGTREEWLEAAVKAIRPMFEDQGLALPDTIRLSCGWPTKPGKNAIGWCYKTSVASDRATHIFVSPMLENARQILAVLVHELIHAHDDCASKHGGAFAKAHKALGLVGKPTTSVPGPGLEETLTDMAGRLGDYPHRSIDPTEEVKPQTTRMLKVECEDCGCVVRMTRKWLDEVGPPRCACTGRMYEDGFSPADLDRDGYEEEE